MIAGILHKGGHNREGSGSFDGTPKSRGGISSLLKRAPGISILTEKKDSVIKKTNQISLEQLSVLRVISLLLRF